MAPGPGLSLAAVGKRFAGSAPVLADFGLDVAPGSVLAILGPSGVGKSTLLRLIAGIDDDMTGSIAINGLPAGKAAPPGIVFQDARLLPWLTAAGNVAIADPVMRPDTTQAMLEQVGLANHANAHPYQLSGGMQRRVAIARALAVNAGLLLLDEPFVSLDRALADEMHAMLGRLITQHQPTVVLVTHWPEDAARLADRVIVLDGRPARITADTTFPVPRALRDRPTIEAYRDQLAARLQT